MMTATCAQKLGMLALFLLVSCDPGPPDSAQKGRHEAPASVVPGTPLAVSYEVTGDPHRPTIEGSTNLPDGTQVSVTFGKTGVDYATSADGTVADGKFKLGPVDSFGKDLPPGAYEVEFSTPLADVQPASVRMAVGADYENFTGPLLEEQKFGRVVSVKQKYAVPGSFDAIAKASLRNRRIDVGREYARGNCIRARELNGEATRTPKAVAEITACVTKNAPRP